MKNPEIDLRSLPFHDLLSAPLTAAIEAQQQASLGLVGFLHDVGFDDGEGEERRPGVRMVDFVYRREALTAEGKRTQVDTRLRIPLLSMISLPNLEIDRLDVSVLVSFQSAKAQDVSPRLRITPQLQKRYPFLRGHSRLKVSPTSRKTLKGEPQPTRPYELEIRLTATSAEPTDGVDRLLTALTGAMSEETR